MNPKPIITIKEARRLLGKKSDELNDVEIMQIVKNLQMIAQEYLRKKSVNPSNDRLGLEDGLSETESK